MSLSSQPIGVFDSGVGGLTVLNALHQRLPNESFLYLGDCARVPYGTKSAHTVMQYALQIAHFLVHQQIKALVIACNTASAHALPRLQQYFPTLPIIGVIKPGAQAAIQASRNGEIAVIATKSTVNSQAYSRAIAALAPHQRVVESACSLFVSLVEEGWTQGSLLEAILARYLLPLFQDPAHHPDTLLLGCTHFPVLSQAIAQVIGQHIAIIDSAQTTACAVADSLTAHRLHAPLATAADTQQRPALNTHFFVTDSPQQFAQVASIFLPTALNPHAITAIDLKSVSTNELCHPG